MHDFSNAVFLTDEIRQIEQQAFAIPNPPDLMEQAGLAAAQIAQDELLKTTDRNILILAGPGNNGGDAFVVARHLQQWGHLIDLVFTGKPEKLSIDAEKARQSWLSTNSKIHTAIPAEQNWDLVIDGLFGIGLDQKNGRNLDDHYVELIQTVQRMTTPVLALDIPSGLGSDNGCIHGIALRADITITFIGLKPGLLTHDGPDYSGRIIVRDLDLNPTTRITPQIWQMDTPSVQPYLPPPRQQNSHKGSYGSVGILGGATGMVGAAILAGRAALKLGAGRVYLGLLDEHAPRIDFTQPELMFKSPQTLLSLDHLNSLIVGPGLGTDSHASALVGDALHTDLPLVLDADALNLIASQPVLAQYLTQRTAPTILTPHPAEAARLLGTTTAYIQHNRLDAVKQLAQRFQCDVVLKGTGSICATPTGHCHINTSGNPGLSTAGTGDVLSGIIGALIAQGIKPTNALRLAVHLHGAAADNLLIKNHGTIGMTASEIIEAARDVLNQWAHHK